MASYAKSPPKVVQPLHPQPVLANKLEEMSDSQWSDYQKNATKWYNFYASRDRAVLKKGEYLYHATGVDNLGAIKVSGLCPRDPTWKAYDKKQKVPRFDSSKDGYLSMATKSSGAGAMGGKSVLLRMKIGDDIDNWDFRTYGTTEVRTVIGIPADRLEVSKDWATWSALS